MKNTKASASLLSVCALFSAMVRPAFASYNQAPGTDYLLSQTISPQVSVDSGLTKNPGQREAGANSLAVPNPILATGSNLKSASLSPNAMLLANQLAIGSQLARLPELRSRAQQGPLSARLEYEETREQISEVLRGAEMDVNYVLAEIYDEQGIYNELVGSYSSERDKIVAYTNMVSFGTNGVLWAVCEALAIPTATRSKYAVSSGITGILAGIVPSIASAITLKEVNGKKHSAPAAPNMLAKMFDRPTSTQNDFPPVVWDWLNSPPADNQAKKRRDLIIDRWIADSNIPAFTDRSSQSQIDTVTASTEQRKSVNIPVLSARLSMLSQLASEVFKMNRLLDEMEMTLRGSKNV